MKTKYEIASLLQDAYWYADRATGNKEEFYRLTRGQALAQSFAKAKEAGLKLSRALFPRTLSSADALLGAIVRYGDEQGVDARCGEVSKLSFDANS